MKNNYHWMEAVFLFLCVEIGLLLTMSNSAATFTMGLGVSVMNLLVRGILTQNLDTITKNRFMRGRKQYWNS